MTGGASAAAGRAVVDVDVQRLAGVGVLMVAVRGGAACRGAVEPGPAARVTGHGVGAAGPCAVVSCRNAMSSGALMIAGWASPEIVEACS